MSVVTGLVSNAIPGSLEGWGDGVKRGEDDSQRHSHRRITINKTGPTGMASACQVGN